MYYGYWYWYDRSVKKWQRRWKATKFLTKLPFLIIFYSFIFCMLIIAAIAAIGIIPGLLVLYGFYKLILYLAPRLRELFINLHMRRKDRKLREKHRELRAGQKVKSEPIPEETSLNVEIQSEMSSFVCEVMDTAQPSEPETASAAEQVKAEKPKKKPVRRRSKEEFERFMIACNAEMARKDEMEQYQDFLNS